jgi:hypothetical protein
VSGFDRPDVAAYNRRMRRRHRAEAERWGHGPTREEKRIAAILPEPPPERHPNQPPIDSAEHREHMRQQFIRDVELGLVDESGSPL